MSNTELADMRRQQAATSEQQAVNLLTHYMQQAWEAAGLTWHEDHDTEVASIVELTVAAAVATIRAEL